MLHKIPAYWLFKLMSFYPPYFFSGITVVHVNRDSKCIKVRLRTGLWNQNFVGTHFGGSLFSMTDPFLMIMLFQLLGKEYIVWDKETRIEFIKAVREPVFAHFRINDHDLELARQKTLEQFKYLPTFECTIETAKGDLVAKVYKTLYIRRKDAKERFAAQ
jgi:acyl-coenzyme A thioesterase PaaI-like protein